MPVKHPCRHIGCAALVDDPGYCSAHKREARRYDEHRGSAHSRGYDRAWQKLREVILLRDPFCVICRKQPATEVDHIVAKRFGGGDEWENLQGLCKACHTRKTDKENRNGVQSGVAASQG